MSEKRKRGIPLKPNALALIDQKMNETGYKNRDYFAEAAGLNTKTVVRIFQGHQPQRDTVKALAKALGILSTDLANQRDLYPTVSNSVRQKKNLGELDRNVCRAMLQPKRELASNLLTSGMGIKFELNDIHVPLGLVERPQKVQRRDDASPEEGSRVYREEKEKITPIDYDDFFQQVLANQQSPKSNGKRLNIIGEPGAGKTTQLLKIADWVLDETGDLPIWISLGVVGEKPLQEYLLKDWLRDAAGKLDAAPPEWVEQLEQHLKNGRVWLLLDGADEMQVADPLGKLAEFVRVPLLKNVRVVLTCRLNLWDATGNALSEFDTYKMLDFSYGDGKNSDQVKQFIDKWFGNPSPALPYKEREQEASPRVGGTEGGQQLRKALDETGKERIKDLARHPLRLALLCFTWQSRRGLPDTKAELYEMFVEALYVLKKGVFRTTAAQQIDLNAALGRLALKAIDKGFKSILPHSLVYEELKKPHPELFELAEKLGWLNQVGDEPENPLKPVYAFFHPTFQEYFAACAIPKDETWRFFLNHIAKTPTKGTYRIFDPALKEVYLLWMGQPKEKVPDEEKEKLIKALVEFDDETDPQFYGRVAYCLAAAGIAEFNNCSRAKEIIRNIVYLVTNDFPDIVSEVEWEALLQTDSKIAIDTLVKLLQDSDDEDVCDPAAYALGSIDRSNPIAVEFLTMSIQNTEYEYKHCWLARCLGEIDKGNQNAVSFLLDLIPNCYDDETFEEIYWNLKEIGKGNQIVVETLVNLIQESHDDNVIKLALALLGEREIGKGYPIAIEAIIELIEESLDDNYENEIGDRCLQAIISLGKIGQGERNAIKILIDFIQKVSSELPRALAASSLKNIAQGNQIEIAIETLVELSQNAQDEYAILEAA